MNIHDWRDLSHNLPSYIYLDLGPLQRRDPQVTTPWALTIPCLPSSVRCAAAVWQTFFFLLRSIMCVWDCGRYISRRGGAKYKGRHEECQLTSSWSKSPEKVGLRGLCLSVWVGTIEQSAQGAWCDSSSRVRCYCIYLLLLCVYFPLVFSHDVTREVG